MDALFRRTIRTTWNIVDDMLDEVKQYAGARTIPAGRAVSALFKQAPRRPLGTRLEDGSTVFDVPANSSILTVEQTLTREDKL